MQPSKHSIVVHFFCCAPMSSNIGQSIAHVSKDGILRYYRKFEKMGFGYNNNITQEYSRKQGDFENRNSANWI
jgi:hypothetical protein